MYTDKLTLLIRPPTAPDWLANLSGGVRYRRIFHHAARASAANSSGPGARGEICRVNNYMCSYAYILKGRGSDGRLVESGGWEGLRYGKELGE